MILEVVVNEEPSVRFRWYVECERVWSKCKKVKNEGICNRFLLIARVSLWLWGRGAVVSSDRYWQSLIRSVDYYGILATSDILSDFFVDWYKIQNLDLEAMCRGVLLDKWGFVAFADVGFFDLDFDFFKTKTLIFQDQGRTFHRSRPGKTFHFTALFY